MTTNNSEPSNIIVERILKKSDYYKSIMNLYGSLQEEIDRTQDTKILLKLNNKMQLQIQRMLKLKEYGMDIHEKFETIPFRSKRLQQAETYFYQGKFQEMDEVLDASEIRAEIEILKKDYSLQDEDLRKKTQSQLEYKSYELLIKGLYHCTYVENPNWNEDVLALLTEAHDADANIHTIYEFASYLSITDEQKRAAKMMNEAYTLAHNTEGDEYRLYEAKSLHAMGAIEVRKNNHSKVIEYTGEALKVYTKLSEKNPDEYRPKMSLMLSIMGIHYTFSANYSVALVVLEQAAEIMRELALQGNSEYYIHLGNVLDQIASVYLCEKEYAEAIAVYEEALQIIEYNIDRNYYHLLKSKADTLYSLTVALTANNDYEAAIRKAKEELEVRKLIQEIDPIGQLQYIAKTRELLATLYSNSPEKALLEREKIVQLYRILAEHSPETWLSDLGDALNICSNQYARLNLFDKYIQVIKESLEVFNRLAADNPEYLLIVGCLLGNMSNYYEKIAGDKTKMLENARKAYKILSSVERSGIMSEAMYTMVKRMLGK